jgi:hypothetical protein
MQLQAALLAARLRVLLNEQTAESAITPLIGLDADWFSQGELAAIYYTIWQIDRSREADRQVAAAIYTTLATTLPTALNRARAARLTGVLPALSAPLPAPPTALGIGAVPSLAALTEQIEQLVMVV